MAFTVGEWQSWFCQFTGLPLLSMLVLSTNAHGGLRACAQDIVRNTSAHVCPGLIHGKLLRLLYLLANGNSNRFFQALGVDVDVDFE